MLYLGALGDRYGRKLMLILGIGARRSRRRLLAAWAPSDEVLVRRPRRRRALGGHGLPDDARADHRAVVGARAHEVDRALVGASAARSPRSGRSSPGALLEHFWWGSVFLLTLPLAVVALVLAILLVPAT